MHKSERLFQLVNLLKGRKVAVTARQLAEKLDVSERTIYRDIQNLQTSGVPVEGEAGIGYLISDCDLPPLMFSMQELQALLIGSRMLSAWTDPEQAKHAQSAIAKIEAVLPTQLKQLNDALPYYALGFKHDETCQAHNKVLREAIEAKNHLSMTYIDVKQDTSERTIEPLGLVYWGGKWTVIAYCLLRQAYREFRLDRIVALSTLDSHFEHAVDKNLAHYIELVKTAACEKENT
ncbi:DNA-binding transcriptional regulator [Pseudoalteromonas luteoviolacea]|uniref:DNA-binding transcriptional regulator n=1 Tax=Pseudoalteromonas luteoviolacea TaxID=43657 RepID=A0A1C0TSP9_9GAMM|nr:YafY family protein [Pseudoalteromonas luteoviolacea]MBQ4810937.1 YafY family transcriptional regulator [Pseudoalteromonas luteoviolacea]OCQ22272.1 DNA-binding transcriptional regulator [Pseudoalteromonas luteoviolacea]